MTISQSTSMTPYQRCLATVEGRRPDRVPASFQGIACDVSSKILGHEVATGSPSLWYAEAKAWMKGKNAHEEFVDQVVENVLELCRVLGVEVYLRPWRKADRPSRQLDEFTFLYGDSDGVHSIWRWDPEVMNFVQVRNTAPRPRPEDWPQVAREVKQQVATDIEYVTEHSGEEEEKLQKRLGHEMLVMSRGGGISLGLSEEELMACLLEPGAVADILDCRLEVALAELEALARRGLKVISGGGDMADKNGPIYSPQVFRELMMPRLIKLAGRAKGLGIYYIWGSDGNLWPVSDMIFVEAGFPGYAEVDRDAGMTVGKLHERYPELVVWTNVSVDTMRRKSRQEVYEHCMTILRESGGMRYIHGCSNAILPGTPPENVFAMLEARNDYIYDIIRCRLLRNSCGGHRSPPSIDENIRYCSILEGAVPSAPLEMAISQNPNHKMIKGDLPHSVSRQEGQDCGSVLTS